MKKLLEVSARLSFHGQKFQVVSRDAMNEVELLWGSTFGAMYRAYYASQVAHWNTKSRNFSQDHALFQKQYEYWQETIDEVAEHIRTYDVELPEKLSTFVDSIELEIRTDALGYIQNYLNRLLQVLALLVDLNEKCTNVDDIGSLDLIGGLVRSIRKNYFLCANNLEEPDRTNAMTELNKKKVKIVGPAMTDKEFKSKDRMEDV